MTLDEHITHLIEEMGAKRERVNNMFRAATRLSADGATFLLPDPVTTEDEYWVALHELGHARTHGHKDWAAKLIGELDDEAWAWEWAMENAIIPVSDRAWTMAYIGLMSHTFFGSPFALMTTRYSRMREQAEQRLDRKLLYEIESKLPAGMPSLLQVPAVAALAQAAA